MRKQAQRNNKHKEENISNVWTIDIMKDKKQ